VAMASASCVLGAAGREGGRGVATGRHTTQGKRGTVEVLVDGVGLLHCRSDLRSQLGKVC
jgi:hypothetical protein